MKKFKGIIISAARSDYDRYVPILNDINKNSRLRTHLFLTKDHLNPKYGKTKNFVNRKYNLIFNNYKEKEFDKNQITNLSDDLSFLSKKLIEIKPNFIIILGDRYEMLLGSLIAIPKKLPTFHFFGGSVTEGSSDELVRHAITKMSHLHFVAHEKYKKRLLQMGEERWRIFNIGVPSLSKIKSMKFDTKNDLEKKYKFNFYKPFALLTYHPTSAETEDLKTNLNIIAQAIKKEKLNLVVTYPNADLGNEKIIKYFNSKFNDREKYLIIKNCGQDNYLNIANHSKLIIGNSSSGIVEAASIKTPVINLGTRQKGKIAPKNVINCDFNVKNILKILKKIKTKSYANMLSNINNPYEKKIKDGFISTVIVKALQNKNILKKKFMDYKNN